MADTPIETRITTLRSQPRRISRFVPFGLMYASYAGIAGIALPLFAGVPHLAGEAVALQNFGVVVGAPYWGWLSRRTPPRRLLTGTLVGAGLAFAALSIRAVAVLLLASFAFGFFAAAALTLSTLLVTGWYPRAEWDAKIGTLQATMSVGRVIGLLAAAVLLSRLGLALFGGGLFCAAALWASRLPPTREARQRAARAPSKQHRRRAREWLRRPPSVIDLAGAVSAYHLAHTVRHTLRQLVHRTHKPQDGSVRAAQPWRPLVPFLAQWSMMALGVAPLFTLYPLLMEHTAGFTQAETAGGYAVAVALGVLMYGPSGRLAVRYGSRAVLIGGLIWRGAGLFFVAAVLFLHAPGVLVLLGFILVMLSWSPLAVGGNAHAAELATPGRTGSVLGLFNSTQMLGTMLGSLIGGAVVPALGYALTMLLCGTALALAALWAICSRAERLRPPALDS